MLTCRRLHPLSLSRHPFWPFYFQETKKSEDHKMKEEEEKPYEEGKQDNKDGEDKKNKAEKEEECKDGTEKEILLKVYMHCEGCARKVRRSLEGFEGVEEVATDYRTNRVVVKGEKADPVKVLGRVQKKNSHRQVELLSPIPKPSPPPPPPEEEKKKPDAQEQPNPPEKIKEEAKVVTVVLKVHMHCEACAQGIKKRILRMKGVESVQPDLKGSQVSVTGVFEPAKVVEYVYKRTGKHAVIVKEEEEKKKEEEKEKKGEPEAEAVTGDEEEVDIMGRMGMEMELKKNESLYYPPSSCYLPRFVPMEFNGGSGQPNGHQYQYQYQYLPVAAAYPPQMFSEDNPNSCSVM